MLRPNPPRMVTVLIAVGLLILGLALALLPSATVKDVLTGLPLPGQIDKELLKLARSDTVAYACLLASPLLLVAGSLLPGI